MTRKHEVNIKKSKWINFQLLVIALLSFSYFMYEIHMYSDLKNDIAEAPVSVIDNPEEIDIIYAGVRAIPNEPEVVVKPKPQVVTEVLPVEVKIDTPDPVVESQPKEPIVNIPVETVGKSKPVVKAPISKTGSTTTTKKTGGVYDRTTVDFLPVFPGCDKYSTNDERAACFQKKIQRHVNRKFNDGLGEELNLKGVQRIQLYFEIDENGEVSNVKARSRGKIIDLEKEAIRVAKLLPKMDPARSGTRKVKMAYNMPIVFDVR